MNRRICLLFTLAVGVLSLHAQQQPMRIWYNTPAPVSIPQSISQEQVKVDYNGNGKKLKMRGSVWENLSLPLGNSSLGATLLQSTPVDRIVLNEKSLWSGGPNSGSGAKTYWAQNPNSARQLPAIRQAFVDGDQHAVDSLTCRAFSGTIPYNGGDRDTLRFGSFTTMGECFVSTGLNEADSRSFVRELSLDEAVNHVSFQNGGANYRRSCFVSYPDQALVMRYEADKRGLQNLEWCYLPNPRATGRWTTERDGMVYTATLNNNGLPYAIRVKARAKGGSVKYDNGRIIVRGADYVDFILTAATGYVINKHPDFSDPRTYYGQDPVAITAQHMTAAAAKSYKKLYKRHVADYQRLYNRLTLSINPGKQMPDVPIDERIDRYREGSGDNYLETLFYQYGRYMAIAASRGATLPMNLQGIWCKDVSAIWSSDYHNNINLQMNYWPICSANLDECFQPFVEYLQMIYEPGKLTAKAMFDAQGWTANISTNPFGFTGPLQSWDMGWNLAAINGPWLATHIWDYYDYTRDRGWLAQTGYPLLRESARFVCGYLWRQSNGRYTAAPSTSPEHGPIDKGATFANAVAKEVLMQAVEASKILATDEGERAQWDDVLRNIEPYQIGRYGQLMEWSRDIDNPKDEHRHTNHLFGLFPGTTISPVTTPQLAEAAKVVLEHRGDFSTGWSMGWKLNLWAHLMDGNRSYKLLQNLLSTGVTYNLWDTHPPFQIDGNFGGLSGMTEMLVQSNLGYIHLLPALPDAWQQGSVCGVRARGNFTLDIRWNQAANPRVEVSVLSGSGGPCKLTYKQQTKTIETVKGKRYSVTFTE